MREITMVTIYFPPCGAFFDASTGSFASLLNSFLSWPGELRVLVLILVVSYSFIIFSQFSFLCADDNFYKAAVAVEKIERIRREIF